MEPTIRLNGYTGEWKELLFDQIFQERHELSTISDLLPQLSFTIAEGVIEPENRKTNKRDFLIKDIATKKYLITRYDDIIYNPANVIYGAIHRNKLHDGVVSPIYKIFETTQCSGFMENVVRRPSFIHEITKFAEGTVKKLKTLKPEVFLRQSAFLPPIEEQNSISQFFDNLNALLMATEKKLESLSQMKAASLQAMFPQNEEVKPKLRIGGFSSDWEIRKFSDITYPQKDKNKEGRILESYSISNEYGFVPQSLKFSGGKVGNANKSNSYIVTENTFAYNPARINVGSLGYYDGKQDVLVSQLYVIFKTTEDIDDLFLLYWFKTPNFKRIINQFQEGSVRLCFSYEKLCSSLITIPSIEEQQSIGKFFRTLDKQIALEAKKYETLKRIKSACLDKMFV